MKKLFYTSSGLLLSLSAATAAAHPGHGLGTLGHDLQHQLWTFGALIVMSAVCMFQGRNSNQE